MTINEYVTVFIVILAISPLLFMKMNYKSFRNTKNNKTRSIWALILIMTDNELHNHFIIILAYRSFITKHYETFPFVLQQPATLYGLEIVNSFFHLRLTCACLERFQEREGRRKRKIKEEKNSAVNRSLSQWENS